MRVPDIPPTTAAGYAAATNLISFNNYQKIHSDKDYFPFHGPRNTTSGYNISSGEEFVRRALNSSFTEVSNNYNNDNATVMRNINGGEEAALQQSQSLKQHCGQFSDSDIITKRNRNNPTNVILDNKRHNSINDISNIRSIIDENHITCNVLIKNQDASSISLLTNDTDRIKNNYSNNNVEKQVNEANANGCYYDASLADNYYGESYDSDYDYHSICGFGTDDSDEKDDIFLISSSSSSDTLQTRPHFHFPRGIINPNYPGFQHLAHTLSEHFRNSSSFDIHDSDMSDTDKEFNVANSLDSLVEAMSQTHVNMLNNNFEHLSLSGDTDESVDESSTQFRSRRNSENTSSKSQILGSSYTWPQSDEYSNNMGNYQLDAPAIHSNTRKNILTQSSPPDILMKNIAVELKSGTENRPDILHGVSPQLLQKFLEEDIYENNECVEVKMTNPTTVATSTTTTDSTNTIINSNIKSIIANKIQFHSDKLDEIIIEGCTEKCSNSCNAHQKANDDVINLGIMASPVNIIGDFGLEVEHEFGLLVSGYKRLDDPMNYDDKQMLMGNGHIPNKTLNVTLSKSKVEMMDTNHLEDTNAEQKENIKESSSTVKIHSNVNDKANNNVTLMSKTNSKMENSINFEDNVADSTKQGQSQTMKYQKRSYDDRQLPPVAIEYKTRYQLNERKGKTSSQNHKLTKCERRRQQQQKQQQQQQYQSRSRSNHLNRPVTNTKYGNKIKVQCNDANVILMNNNCKRDEELELHQYQQLLKHKEEILSNSKYTKLSSWAQYLNDSIQNSKDTTTNTLELIDAYKIGPEIDMETLQQHIKLAKEIEKKRRNNREEIRRRLAMGNENENETEMFQVRESDTIARIQPLLQNDMVSDADETNSSDSETCPKLSKFKLTNCLGNLSNNSNDPYAVSATSIQPSYSNNDSSNHNTFKKDNEMISEKQIQPQQLLKSMPQDIECDFFTKQAKLQIETRMALAQAKEMAHRQMEINRQNHCRSPITVIIRDSLEQINVLINSNTRRVSRYLLTELNIAQLQILVNNFQTYIKELNDTLVNYLMERDDLHLNQDAILADIEELTCYLGVSEQIAHQERFEQ